MILSIFPRGVNISFKDDYVRLTYPWFNGVKILYALVALVFFGFVGYQSIFANIKVLGPQMDFPMYAGFIITIIYIFYIAANKTEIIFKKNALGILHCPFPWFGNKLMVADKIESFYHDTITKSHYTKRGFSYEEITTFTFPIYARLKNGESASICEVTETNDAVNIVEVLNNRLKESRAADEMLSNRESQGLLA